MAPNTTQADRELAHRSNAGIDVTLLWNERTNELVVTVYDSSTGEFLELPAARERALDVFHHPYAYAAQAGWSEDRDESSSHAAWTALPGGDGSPRQPQAWGL